MPTVEHQRAELVASASRGDEDAFAALVRQERATLVMAARAIVGDLHEAEDAAQEALILAHGHLRDLRDLSRFGPWLSRILTRVALRRRRALRRRPEPRPLAGAACEDPPRNGRHEDLVEAVLALPDAYRVPLSLFYLRGHSYREVAAITGLPVKRVKSRLFDARARLRNTLREDEP